jgi:subtilisin family serine protease
MKKRMLFSMFLVVMLLLSGSGFSAAQAKAPAVQPAADPSYVPGELIVGFSPDQAPGELTAQADTVATSVGATVLKSGLGGMALLKAPDGADIYALAASLKNTPGVKYAEPNYTVKLVDPPVDQAKVPQSSYVIRTAKTKDGQVEKMAYPIAGLKAARVKSGSTVKATYPNDPALWGNWGWDDVGADVVWNNTTASKNVCVIDTGVDYKHPDLAGKVIKGFDFVNYDADPMDDFGHGTHVAGIIAAVANNGKGIAGVSTGKVVAVKVLDANGYGTNYDVAQGIYYCANRSDVNILSLSLGGDASTSEYYAIDYAVNPPPGSNRVGKLVVAAAGNDASMTPSYPAGYADTITYPEFSGKVLAVGAAGYEYQDAEGNWHLDQNCQATYSNYGSWVNFVAPGTDILSTTPYDKPFALNQFGGVPTRYAYLSGTSMATPFVSAVAARAWGYKPTLSNSQIEAWLHDTGLALDTNPSDNCWNSTMSLARLVSVSGAIERGAITLSGVDANTDMPLVGATVSLYLGTSLKASAVITSLPVKDPYTGAVIGASFKSWADLINLPTPGGTGATYTPRISLTNYTASAQNAFDTWYNADGTVYPLGGLWIPAWAAVPQKSANFAVVGEALGAEDPSLVGWLPDAEPFIVNPYYYKGIYGDPDVGPYGAMNEAPFARWLNFDWYFESLIIRNRPGVSALPYYQGTYYFRITDRGNNGDDNLLDKGNTSVFVWKDGVIKYRLDKGGFFCGPDYHWWDPFSISSGGSGSPSYNYINWCGAKGSEPY